jgi:hypothetical protein
VEFTKQVNIIESKYQAMIHVGPYLTNKVIPTIKKYVYNARKSESRIPLQWKNNSCKSINHILKLNQDFKPEKLPELINKIHKEIIVLQESLVNGALYGHGDYELNSSVSHLQCTKIIWQSKNQKEKDTVTKILDSWLKKAKRCYQIGYLNGWNPYHPTDKQLCT